jgi:hypothetical protein
MKVRSEFPRRMEGEGGREFSGPSQDFTTANILSLGAVRVEGLARGHEVKTSKTEREQRK